MQHVRNLQQVLLYTTRTYTIQPVLALCNSYLLYTTGTYYMQQKHTL